MSQVGNPISNPDFEPPEMFNQRCDYCGNVTDKYIKRELTAYISEEDKFTPFKVCAIKCEDCRLSG